MIFAGCNSLIRKILYFSKDAPITYRGGRFAVALTIQILQAEGWDRMMIIGPIDEEAEVHLTQFLKTLGQKVVVNFRQITTVNSCGVRAWINFMRELSKGRQVVFEECKPEIISQINMIPSFRASAHIQSVYGSYDCPKCKNHQDVLLTRGKNLPNRLADGLPEIPCAKCQAPLELDELEEEYFAWLDAA